MNGYDSVTAILNTVAGRPYDPTGDSSRPTGTAIHRVLQMLVNGVDPGRPADYPLAQRNRVAALLAFNEALAPRFIGSEVPVHSEQLQVVGRIDYTRACMDPTCPCGGAGIVLGDTKTGRVTRACHVQAGSAYPVLWAEQFGSAPCRAEILALHADGTYELIGARAASDDFDAAVQWYRRLQNIDLSR